MKKSELKKFTGMIVNVVGDCFSIWGELVDCSEYANQKDFSVFGDECQIEFNSRKVYNWIDYRPYDGDVVLYIDRKKYLAALDSFNKFYKKGE